MTAAAGTFADGYQAALRDLAEANDRGGATALFEWISNNTTDPRVRALVAHLVPGGSR